MHDVRDSVLDQRLVWYYSGKATDDKGRYLAEILQWPDEKLEVVHDFIQWMFPLTERGFNPNAPVLDRFSISEFRARPELQEKLRASLQRMLTFYGLETQQGKDQTITPANNFKERARTWLLPGNHNHLRITRILKSLRTLGLELEAKALFNCLVNIYEDEKGKALPAISTETFWFWQSAACDPR
jgi:hypothetical protein